jgi:uncharacterized protein (TIGR02246 family)
MTMPQDKATIQKLIDAFAEAFNRGDTASMATMYTEDAYLLPPQTDIMRGRAAIQQFWQAASEQIGDMKLTIVDVEPLGSDAAREIGTVTAKTKGQPQQEVVGKYVVVWRKVGNDWKLATDIWNFNN